MSKYHTSVKASRGFTLVELLVVITIIAVLMGLLFPVVGAAKQTALKAVAKTASTNLVVALTQFNTEYGIYPDIGTTGADTIITGENKDLMKILRAKETEEPLKNPRKIPFFTYKDAKSQTKPRDGFDAQGNLMDPWGYFYSITYDTDYDNQVTVTPYAKTLDAGAAVWTFGRDNVSTGTVKGTDDVVSWE